MSPARLQTGIISNLHCEQQATLVNQDSPLYIIDFSRTSLAKFAGSSNYQVRSLKMRPYLISKDLWDVFKITPKSANTDELKS